MPGIWSRLDGRHPHQHRRRELYTHRCSEEELGNSDDKSSEQEEKNALTPEDPLNHQSLTNISGSALMLSSDVRLSYTQGGTSLLITISGPTSSKRESAYDKAEVIVRLRSHVGVMALHPLSAVGSPPEKRRFLEARHQQLQEVYASDILPLVQTSVEAVICLEEFPRSAIVIDILVLAEDGSLCAAVLNGVMSAILEAGLPCRTSFAAVSVAALTGDPEGNSLSAGKRSREGSAPPTEAPEKGNTAPTPLCFFVDPSAIEETLTGTPEKNPQLSKSVIAASSDSTPHGHLLRMQQQCRTVALGTFVLSFRPEQLMAGGRYPTIASHIHCGPGASRGNTLAHSESKDENSRETTAFPSFLSPKDLVYMEHLASLSITPIFDFYRQLNVTAF